MFVLLVSSLLDLTIEFANQMEDGLVIDLIVNRYSKLTPDSQKAPYVKILILKDAKKRYKT